MSVPRLPRVAVNAMHFGLVGPALAYAGYKSYKGELELSPAISIAVLLVGLFVIVYHLMIFFKESLPQYKASMTSNQTDTPVDATAPPAPAPAQTSSERFDAMRAY